MELEQLGFDDWLREKSRNMLRKGVLRHLIPQLQESEILWSKSQPQGGGIRTSDNEHLGYVLELVFQAAESRDGG